MVKPPEIAHLLERQEAATAATETWDLLGQPSGKFDYRVRYDPPSWFRNPDCEEIIPTDWDDTAPRSSDKSPTQENVPEEYDDAISEIFRATPMKVTAMMNDDLNLPYSDDEIKATLFQMHLQEISSKVVANRLKKCLLEIISPLQSAYAPGRLISDNTLVATEVAHFMHKLKTQEEGFFSLKLDISKAYDRLEWPFLQSMVNHLNKSTLLGVSDRVILYHIPYLFILCAEGGFQSELATILEVERVEEHDRYLGLAMRVEKSKTQIFQYIKEKLSNKMENWKAKILSCAGKEILIKAVAQTMPLYAMNCYLLPKTLCDDIHKLCASFFWGDTNDKMKIHWRSWKRLCLTKHEGGMGFKNIYAYNLAMLAKQGWRIVTNPTSFIARLYKAKYFPHCDFWQAELGDAPSFSWRSILAGSPILKDGTK
ncbi:uncharacterized protein LOC133744586 [Rosa rugosa]|uniref:uncharacterized protein LOC133744586 n=1 Tax=Rosa rugosa TaxID=74645 RepID=UPI002B40996E|nr:uncharacterized protein LOC133744586 [Rosa rugosa]